MNSVLGDRSNTRVLPGLREICRQFHVASKRQETEWAKKDEPRKGYHHLHHEGIPGISTKMTPTKMKGKSYLMKVVMKGVGHLWPNGRAETKGIVAAERLWAFFSKYKK